MDDFINVVRYVSSEDPLPRPLNPDFERALRSIDCYCGKVRSILALRQKDCIHESHFRAFQDYRGALVSLPGWEFNLMFIAPSRSRRRVYRVLRTHSRLIAHGRSPVFPSVSGLLEVRFVGSEYVRLEVEGLPESGSLRARVMVRDGNSEQAIVPEFTQPIRKEGLDTYRELDRHLELAFCSPAQAPEILQRVALEFSGGPDPDYPVLEIVDSLLSPEAAVGSLEQRIEDIRVRLWDAPVVAAVVRNLLDRCIEAFAADSRFSDFPLKVRADLAALRMPLAKLETGDAYLNPVPSPTPISSVSLVGTPSTL